MIHETQTDPIIAYRGWVAINSRLTSMGVSASWPKLRPASADCSTNYQEHNSAKIHPQNSPVAECDCGLYGYKRIPQLEQLLGGYNYGDKVFGRVALWGEVIETELGYRAEFGYPQVLYYGAPSADKETVQRIASEYGCDIAECPIVLAGLWETHLQKQADDFHDAFTSPIAASPYFIGTLSAVRKPVPYFTVTINTKPKPRTLWDRIRAANKWWVEGVLMPFCTTVGLTFAALCVWAMFPQIPTVVGVVAIPAAGLGIGIGIPYSFAFIFKTHEVD